MTSLVPLLFYSPRVSARHRRYFKHEVDIVRPRVGVALGQASAGLDPSCAPEGILPAVNK
jgi:hypothetical protein